MPPCSLPMREDLPPIRMKDECRQTSANRNKKVNNLKSTFLVNFICYPNFNLHPFFIRMLTFGESFRILSFAILKASPSFIHPNSVLSFQNAGILCLQEKLQ